MTRRRDVITAVAWSRCVVRECHKGFNEDQARYSLIDPILRSLDWNVQDPKIVRVELRVDSKRGRYREADYVLFNGKSKIGLIEAKSYKGLTKFGCELKSPLKDPCLTHFNEDDEKSRKQLYSLTRSGFKISKGRAVLTDGIRWEIYDPRFWKPGQAWSKKLRDTSMLASVCLIRDQGVVSKTLYKYLRRESF